MRLTNRELIEVVDRCDRYVRLQGDLAKVLSRGVMALAVARKYEKNPFTVNRVNEALVQVSLVDGALELYREKPEVDPLILVSTLPSPALRSSRDSFVSAMSVIIELANIVMHLQRDVSRCEGARTSDDDKER